MPNLVIGLNWIPIFELYVVGVASRTDTKKTCGFKSDWTMCCGYDNHSSLIRGHNWEDLYDHLMNMRTSTLIMNTMFI